MHDLHIHTSLSSCAKEHSELSDYLAVIPTLGLTAAGFSNHLWDSAVPGASSWYAPQDLEHVLSLKEPLRKASCPGTRLLLGCECEYIGHGVISLHPDHAKEFDYVLVAAHHFHMVDFVRPASITGGPELAELFYSRFMEVCDFDFVTGIAHPFVPAGFDDHPEAVRNLFTEKRLEQCFTYAKQAGKTIEINLAALFGFMHFGAWEEYKRLLMVAHGVGCKFHIGSDVHTVDHFSPKLFALGRRFLDETGIPLPELDF